MIDSVCWVSVVVGGEVSAGLSGVPVVPEACDEREEALADAGDQAVRGQTKSGLMWSDRQPASRCRRSRPGLWRPIMTAPTLAAPTAFSASAALSTPAPRLARLVAPAHPREGTDCSKGRLGAASIDSLLIPACYRN